MTKPPSRRRQPPWLWIGLAGIVLVALVVALLVSTGGGDEVVDGVDQVRSVDVSGSPLPEFPDGGAEDSAVGMVAPELRGASFDGTPQSVTRDGRGKLVVFLAHWCSHCQAEVPLIVDHLTDADLPEGVDLVAVSTAVSESQPNFPPSAWLDREGWDLPVIVDDADRSAAEGYGLTGFPFLVGLDPDGRVVGRVSGRFPMDLLDAVATAVTP